jgi:TolA-binding protein
VKTHEHSIINQREERKTLIEEYQYEKDKVELERVEFIKREKLMEHKIKDMESKMREMQAKIKDLSHVKETRTQGL